MKRRILSIVTVVMLIVMTLPAAPVSANNVQYELEGFTLEPSAKWTKGNIKGWAEGECIPFRYTVKNTGNDPVSLNLTLEFDHKTDGTIGIADFEDFVIPAGNITGPTLDGSGFYYWDVTVPAEITYNLTWCARLSNEAGLWPGASMHVRAGGKDVSIAVGRIEMPDLYATKSATVTCDVISYTIDYGNNGDADQSSTTLMDYYDESKVTVTDYGDGTGNGGTITWNIGSLAVGATGSKSYTVSIKEGVADGAEIVNIGSIEGDLAEDDYTDNAYGVTSSAKVSPTASITPDPAEACLGVNLQLQGNPSGGSGTYTTHSWTGNGATYLTSATIENPVFNSNTAGTYSLTYTVTDANGCVGSDDIAVTWLDCTDPVIVEVTQSSDEPCADVAVNITAHATDDVGVTSVTLKYDSTEVAMTLDSGTAQDGYWIATIPGQPAETTLTIYVTAYDEAGSSDEYGPHDKTWLDCTDPVIVEVTQSSDEPCADVAVNITAHATDDVGVTSVTLKYDSTEVAMTLDSGTAQDGYWIATIPGQPAETTLTIYVTAYDEAGSSDEYGPHDKTWLDCTDPVIVEVTQSSDEPCADVAVNITAHATDDVGVTSVTLKYDSTEVAMTLDSGTAQDGYWIATIPGQPAETTLTIYVTAYDEAGSSDEYGPHDKTWLDCTDPVIVEVTQSSDEPCADVAVNITAHATDDVGVTSVTLKYDSTEVAMTLDSGTAQDGYWIATIPGQPAETTLTIYVTAYDEAGSSDEYGPHDKTWLDCTDPVIVEVTQSSDEPCADVAVNITAHATDDVGVTSVTLKYDSTEVAMTLDSGTAQDGYWIATIPGQPAETTLTIYVTAYDEAGSSDEYGPHDKTWLDCTDPVIVEVTQSSDEPCADVAVNITAHATDDVGVTSVTLKYDSTEVAMTLDSGTAQDGYWIATIPGQPAETTLTIYVTAYDEAGSSDEYGPHDKTWLDCTDPVIVEVTQSSDEPCADVAVNITAHATDDVGVTSVTLKYDSTEVAMTLDSGTAQDGYWIATIPGQPAETTLTIYVTAYDEAGSSDEYGPHDKTWLDCTDPVIVEVTQSSDEPCADVAVNITAHATDDVGVTSVTLKYDSTEVAMTLDSGTAQDGYWIATIPGQPAETTLTIYVTAYDEAGSSDEYGPHDKTWLDCTPVPPAVGAGGGGCPTIKYLTCDWDENITDEPLYRNNRLAVDLLGPSPDGTHSLLLERGTHAPIVGKETHYLIVIRELVEIPAPPENTTAIVAFNITPVGAVFDTDIFLTLGVVQLPENALNVTMAYYDDVDGVWLPMESEAGEPNGVAELTLTAPLTHFSIYGILVELAPPPPPPTPANFAASGLSIVPSVEKIWEPVTFVTRTGDNVAITANIANDGGQEGTYPVSLKLNGETVDTRTVTLNAGQSQQVSFTLSDVNYGHYEVQIVDETGTFTASRTVNWWLIIGIVVGIGLIIWGVAWAVRRRRARKAEQNEGREIAEPQARLSPSGSPPIYYMFL